MFEKQGAISTGKSFTFTQTAMNPRLLLLPLSPTCCWPALIGTPVHRCCLPATICLRAILESELLPTLHAILTGPYPLPGDRVQSLTRFTTMILCQIQKSLL